MTISRIFLYFIKPKDFCVPGCKMFQCLRPYGSRDIKMGSDIFSLNVTVPKKTAFNVRSIWIISREISVLEYFLKINKTKQKYKETSKKQNKQKNWYIFLTCDVMYVKNLFQLASKETCFRNFFNPLGNFLV